MPVHSSELSWIRWRLEGLDSRSRGGLVLTIVAGLTLSGRDIADGGVQPPVVPLMWVIVSRPRAVWVMMPARRVGRAARQKSSGGRPALCARHPRADVGGLVGSPG